MPVLRLIHSRTRRLQIVPIENKERHPLDYLAASKPVPIPWDFNYRSCGAGRLLAGLALEAKREFEMLATYLRYPGMTALIREEQVPLSVLFLLAGNVNITMNSFEGRRLLLGVGAAGDVLGLASAISGHCSDVRIETRFPCMIASMRRQDFLGFVARHPAASINLTCELSLEYSRACERLRTLGLASHTKTRLTGLLLEWCSEIKETKTGTRIACALTHEEIGNCIGASRETVTRTLTDLRNRNLVMQCGSIFIVPDRSALAAYGVMASTLDQHDRVVA